MGIFKPLGQSGSGGNFSGGLFKRSWSKAPSLAEPTSDKIGKKPDSQREDFLGKNFTHRAPVKSKPSQEKTDNKPASKSAFDEKPEYTRKQANEWLVEKLHKAENLPLLREILAEDPLKTEETWYQWAERASNRMFGGLDVSAYRDPAGAIGYIISSKEDEQRLSGRRVYLQEEIIKETDPMKKRGKERDLKLFNLFTGGSKK
jgi:hypothetical protein